MNKIRNILKVILNFIVKYYLKSVAPFQILWVRYKHYDLHHMQLYYLWPRSNFPEINDRLLNRLEILRKR